MNNTGTSAMNLDNTSDHHNGHAAVLTSWKDIARYMGKGVRTVQRWEQDFGLPVRRPKGSNKKAVLARPRDLDAWVAMSCASRTELPRSATPQTHSRQAAMAALLTLKAKIETARQLRDSNQLLTAELTAAINTLRSQLTELQLRS